MDKTNTWLFPLPRPDVVWTDTPLLPHPERADGGRCFCCRTTCQSRFQIPESRILTQVALAEKRNAIPQATDPAARIRQTAARDAARKGVQQARLAARRMALRHITPTGITLTTPLTTEEYGELSSETAPFALCAFCHAWHALNGFTAAQGVMVWLPDLHPASVVALNRQTLKAIFTGNKTVRREGKETLSALLQNRVAVEEKYRSWRPVDFAEVLRRHPPSQREALQNAMQGLALVLTPDAFPEASAVN